MPIKRIAFACSPSFFSFHFVLTTFVAIDGQLGHVRLLEAHMACLRQNFEAWDLSQPEEPGDRPTERELEEFAAAEKAHDEKVSHLTPYFG